MNKSIYLILLNFMSFTYCFAQTIDATFIEINFKQSGDPKNITKGINKIYFSANDGIHGRELWVMNNSNSMAQLVKDIRPGNLSGIDISFFCTINDILYFIANDGINGFELWKSDGTESGTHMIKNINASGDSYITYLINYNGNLIFTANDYINGDEVWISDGTTTGTTILKDIYPGINGSYPIDFFIFNNYVFFIANDGTNHLELWKSDGTSTGTSLLKNINVSGHGITQGNNFIIFDNHFYFFGQESINGSELWKSDGTTAGTQLLKDLIPGLGSSSNTILGAATDNYFVFSALSPNHIGYELWKSDGTESGTVFLKDIHPSESGLQPYETKFITHNDKIYFVANNGSNGDELWKTDGTTSGTSLIKDINTGSLGSRITALTDTGSFIIFGAINSLNGNRTLWRSDGTLLGTQEISNINLRDGYPDLNFIQVENSIFFSAENNLNGIELWKTDGTNLNTQLHQDFNHVSGSISNFFNEFNYKLIFITNNGAYGNEPYISDGTITGTNIIKDIIPGNSSSVYTNYSFGPNFTKTDNYLFFRANDGTNGYELFKTDGTLTNTSMVKNISASGNALTEYTFFMEFNNVLYFKADDNIHGEELWRSDGTEFGTYMIKDINIGSGSSILATNYDTTDKKYYAVLNGFLYFPAFDGTEKAIWRTDGTTNGTIKVISIPSSGSNDYLGPQILNAIQNKLFFTTNSNNSSYHDSVWSSDGTQSGCVLLATFNGGSNNFRNSVFNDELYFTAPSPLNLSSKSLYKTDGTITGTTIVKNDLGLVGINYLDPCGNYLYFSNGQNNTNGYELWRTDGTDTGTIKLTDSSIPNALTVREFTCLNNNLFYLHETLPNKVWTTNGHTTTALNVNIINSENLSGFESISKLSKLNDKLIFTARTDKYGNELYSANIDNFLGLNDNQSINLIENRILVYPNPSNGEITISTEDHSVINSIDIYDYSGQKIIHQKSNSESLFLNLQNFNNGIYLIKIKTDKYEKTKKIIIK